MNLLKKPCPNCGKLLGISASYLIQKPYQRKKLAWYQLTPAPTLHCPYCDQRLQSSVEQNPRWFILILFTIWGLPALGHLLEKHVSFPYQHLVEIILIFSLLLFFVFFLKHIHWVKVE